MASPMETRPNFAPPAAAKSNNKIILGIALGGCGCVLLMVPILAAILFPVFAQAREKARTASCMSNVKQMSLGMLLYAQDYDTTYPASKNWMAVTQPYIKNPRLNHCPKVSFSSDEESSGNFGYAYNSQMSGREMGKLNMPEVTGLIYDSSTMTESASDPMTSLPVPPRHSTVDVLGFADGHCQVYTPDMIQALLQSQTPEMLFQPSGAK